MTTTGGEMYTIMRTRIALNEAEYFLAEGQDVADLRRRIEEAMRSGGGFVEFDVAGERSVSVLISSTTQVVISTSTADEGGHDDGDGGTPYGGEYDLV
ncbi:hypothetical protein V8Z69_16470 [Microbacterium aurugineum]|jgi:CRISPR/Cas system CSM-associated protein Csm4 (group 5 of RAMP superfamily)|uniref:hypothetical protein n=1 Tax=Microbacterium TaxID=33882 RepID=UPI001E62EA79|nr:MULTISPECIES: hypothetical protein [unclassified Microbacterium]MCE0509056.1 hypothetical protein [Microbacterium sp. KKR3/1]UUE21185.1 hypothetical protein LRQ07_02630 [Microbacterium sp. J1-1]